MIMVDFLGSASKSLAVYKAAIKGVMYSIHLGFVWEGLRAGPLNGTVIVALMLCLTLRHFFGTRRGRAFPRSFFFDYGCLALNTIVLGGLVAMSYDWINQLYQTWLPFTKLRLLKGQPFAVQALVGFLIADSTQFFSHWIRHKVGPLWHIHTIHHSETELGPATHFLKHPFDEVASGVIRYVPVAILGGSVWAGAFLVSLETLWGTFVHSDLRIRFGPLRYILVTPLYHRVHHSIEARHWDKNFGEFLTVWDWLFGTACFDFEESFELGVQGFPIKPGPRLSPVAIVVSWCRLIWYPVRMFTTNLVEGHPLRRMTESRLTE